MGVAGSTAMISLAMKRLCVEDGDASRRNAFGELRVHLYR